MPLSGIAGLVNGVPFMRKWSVGLTSAPPEYSGSNTKEAVGTGDGPLDWNGSCSGYGPIPPNYPGDEITFTGSNDGVDGDGITGPAIVDSVTVNWNQESGEIINWEMAFSGNGAYTLGAQTVAADATVPDPLTSLARKLEFFTVAASPALDAELLDIRSMSFTLSRDNKSYVSSSTGTYNKRGRGPLKVGVTAQVYLNGTDLIKLPNTVRELRMYTTATLFWKLKWIRLNDFTDWEVDRESGAIIGARLGGVFAPYQTIGGTPTEGVIQTPAASPVTIWPAA